jgi:hypothetical protein
MARIKPHIPGIIPFLLLSLYLPLTPAASLSPSPEVPATLTISITFRLN